MGPPSLAIMLEPWELPLLQWVEPVSLLLRLTELSLLQPLTLVGFVHVDPHRSLLGWAKKPLPIFTWENPSWIQPMKSARKFLECRLEVQTMVIYVLSKHKHEIWNGLQ